jgi:hypothetical protein
LPLSKEIETQKKNETLEEWIGKYQDPMVCPVCSSTRWNAVIRETKWKSLIEASTSQDIRSKIFTLIRLRLLQQS